MLIPLVGILLMVASAFVLAIVQEDEVRLAAQPARVDDERSNVIPFRRDVA